MDNKIEHFVLKEDGRIYWVEKMPDEPGEMNYPGLTLQQECDEYERLLQSAIDNAVEVSNQEEVFAEVRNKYLDNPEPYFEWKTGTVYSLLCSVEKKQHCDTNGDSCPIYDSILHKTVALVTFSQPDTETVEETQEELEDGVQLTLSMNLGTFGRVIKALKTDPELWEEVKDELTRLSKEFETRKTP